MLISFHVPPFSSAVRPRRIFSLFREESLPSLGRRPSPENAMHSPRTRRPTVLDTTTLKRPWEHQRASQRTNFTHVLPVRERRRSPLLTRLEIIVVINPSEQYSFSASLIAQKREKDGNIKISLHAS